MCNKVNNNHEHCKQCNKSLSIQAVGQKAVVSSPPLFRGILIFVRDVKCLCFSRSPLNWASQHRQKRLYPCTLLSWKHLSFLSQPCFPPLSVLPEMLDQHQPTSEELWQVCGSSLSPCTFTHLLHAITARERAGSGEEHAAACFCPLLQLVPQLIKADLCIVSSPLSLVHQSDVLAYLSLLLKSSSSLPSSPQVPCSPFAFFSCLAADKHQHPVPSHRPLDMYCS